MLKFETKISISNIITIGIYPLCFTFVPLVFLQKKKKNTHKAQQQQAKS